MTELPRVRHQEPRVDHVVAHRGVGERTRGARSDLVGDVGGAQHDAPHALAPGRRLGAGRSPHDFFRWVKERASMLAGLADSTLSRDEGWSFLVLGRNLERIDMTARLLSARYGESWGPSGWTTTLALLLGVRGLPAHLPPRGRRVLGVGVPAARPAVPALGAARPDRGGAVARRARAPGRPHRRRRRGPAHPRPGARRAVASSG